MFAFVGIGLNKLYKITSFSAAFLNRFMTAATRSFPPPLPPPSSNPSTKMMSTPLRSSSRRPAKRFRATDDMSAPMSMVHISGSGVEVGRRRGGGIDVGKGVWSLPSLMSRELMVGVPEGSEDEGTPMRWLRMPTLVPSLTNGRIDNGVGAVLVI